MAKATGRGGGRTSSIPAHSVPCWQSRWEGIWLWPFPGALPDCRVHGEGGSLSQAPWDSSVATSALSARSAKMPQHCEAKL